ncbi:MAG TPA: sigma-70 family RNA polymerase sigma factor [Telluria sp.]|nr:sigma-70 family RNA polymerase sigma factor [Telluria sp.]
MSERECDQALVLRVQEGDKQAFDLLIAKYQRRLMRMVSYIVHDRAEAEDVLQEVFIKAYRGLRHFRGESAFFTWLFRIGVNTARSHVSLKKRKGAISAAESAGADFEIDGGDQRADIVTPEDVLAGKQIAELVTSAMESMAPEQSIAMTLHEIDGLSYQEIADIMVCPIGTVRSRISHAREVIAGRLQRVSAGQLQRRY